MELVTLWRYWTCLLFGALWNLSMFQSSSLAVTHSLHDKRLYNVSFLSVWYHCTPSCSCNHFNLISSPGSSRVHTLAYWLIQGINTLHRLSPADFIGDKRKHVLQRAFRSPGERLPENMTKIQRKFQISTVTNDNCRVGTSVFSSATLHQTLQFLRRDL